MVLFTNLTPVNKQIEVAQYLVDHHSNLKRKVVSVTEHPIDGVIILFETGDDWTFKGVLAKDLLKIE